MNAFIQNFIRAVTRVAKPNRFVRETWLKGERYELWEVQPVAKEFRQHYIWRSDQGAPVSGEYGSVDSAVVHFGDWEKSGGRYGN